ncbi:3-hydroxyacyl-CoA dehydrogenase/enoyl-CoA hydratase family protein [Metallosphaera tengchongensis]|uniref:3-hydroxyacyl-CoA dehydrogenase/enoyl-CoA hydratase family protein n=2 Tax=Metallosphaera tengchongensis TaxID=1532350 RepID=A0A6N0NW37_9CREN|nr:3-hydroxyacyl-CoA dehydrogenase/enoyl-CoA hydratase family protein [Metallosphaera tengchongensis]
MGHGIAELAAIAGNEVWINDVSKEILEQALSRVRWSLSKLKESGGVKEDVEKIMSRITAEVNQDEALRGSDFVIEAVKEDLELKRGIFKKAEVLAPNAVLATNTSSLPIEEIASPLNSKERAIGMHFFNPPVIMPLVEVVRSKDTSDQTVNRTVEMARSMGKETIVVRDVPGFFVNRVLLRIMEAGCFLVESGRATVEEVDSSAMEELGFPMGVFLLADYTGLDIGYSVWKAVTSRGFEAFPCKSTEKLVLAGNLGVKSGSGYYKYPSPGKFSRPALPQSTKKLGRYLLSPAVNEVTSLIEGGVVSKEDAERGCILGLGLPKGILSYADEIGIDQVVNTLEEIAKETGMSHFRPSHVLTDMVREGKLGVKTGEGFYKYKREERSFSTIIVRVDPPIGWIVLNRPTRYNAINEAMMREINSALDELETDDRVRVIVFTGQGKFFSAGADVTEFQGLTPIKAMIASRKFHEVFLKVQFLTKPVIAAINGMALGGGLELALSADLRVASRGVEIGQPEINLGLIPGGGGTQRLPRLAGKRGLEIVLTGRRVKSEEAKEIGIVDEVVDPEKMEEEVRKLALAIAEKSPIAVALAKLAYNMGMESSIWTGAAYEASLFGLMFSTKDFREGLKAFMERRRPEFRGE